MKILSFTNRWYNKTKSTSKFI